MEDDLDENRETVTYKAIQAYLQDIEFFFKEATFKFDVEDVSHFLTEDNQIYFKVSLNRNLSAITVEGDTIRNNVNRYLEINLNEAEKDLKIVSFYTTKLSEKEELAGWWNSLSFPWRELFAPEISINDSISMADVIETVDTVRINDSVIINEDTLKISGSQLYADLRSLLESSSLNISGNQSIRDISPLSRFTKLKSLNLSNTLVDDLFPIRNLTNLENLKRNHDC